MPRDIERHAGKHKAGSRDYYLSQQVKWGWLIYYWQHCPVFCVPQPRGYEQLAVPFDSPHGSKPLTQNHARRRGLPLGSTSLLFGSSVGIRLGPEPMQSSAPEIQSFNALDSSIVGALVFGGCCRYLSISSQFMLLTPSSNAWSLEMLLKKSPRLGLPSPEMATALR